MDDALLCEQKKQELRLALNQVSDLVRRMNAGSLDWKVSITAGEIDITPPGATYRHWQLSPKRKINISVAGELEDGNENQGV